MGGRFAAALVVVATVSGCGPASPATVTERFSADLAKGNGAAACALLTPATEAALEQAAGTDCEKAILQVDLPPPGAPRSTARFGTMAQVSLAGDVMFLAEFPDGWRVMAAGCAPRPGRSYECQVRGD
jgi:hypothetical protein